MGAVEVVVADDRVTWRFADHDVVIPQPAPPRSVCFVLEQECVVIVEALQGDPSNAAVYDLHGTEVVRLEPPRGADQIGFDQVFVGRDGVVAVFAFRFGDRWGRPDLVTGAVSEWREWR